MYELFYIIMYCKQISTLLYFNEFQNLSRHIIYGDGKKSELKGDFILWRRGWLVRLPKCFRCLLFSRIVLKIFWLKVIILISMIHKKISIHLFVNFPPNMIVPITVRREIFGNVWSQNKSKKNKKVTLKKMSISFVSNRKF